MIITLQLFGAASIALAMYFLCALFIGGGQCTTETHDDRERSK